MPFRRREQTREIAFDAVDHLDDSDESFGRDPAPSAQPVAPDDDVRPAVRSDSADAEPPAPEEVSAPGRTLGTRSGRRRRAVLGGLAATVVLVVGGLTIADTIRGRQADALLRDTPGGVVGLEKPPRELWRIDLGQAWPAVAGELVLLIDEGTIVAHDLSTGEEAWRREDLAGYACQGFPAHIDVPATRASTITCVGGGSPAGEYPIVYPTSVEVLGPGGETLVERALDPSRGIAQPLPNGDLARAARDGRDVVVTVEDARTGEARWTRQVPALAESEVSCQVEQADGTMAEDPDLFYFHDLLDSVTIAGCDVSATFTPTGVELDADDAHVRSLGGGRLVRTPWSGEESEVLGQDGTPLWSAPGSVIEPLSSDGAAPALLFSNTGSSITAHDEHGRELWTFPRYTDQVLLTTRDLTVVASYPGAVALDNATGEELWRWKAAADGGSSSSNITAAFSGRGTLTVVFGADPVERTRWSSIDLEDGSTRWSTTLPIEPWSLFATGGRLYGIVEGGFAAFG